VVSGGPDSSAHPPTSVLDGWAARDLHADPSVSLYAETAMRVARLPSPRSVLSVDPASVLIAIAVVVPGAVAAALFVTQPTWDRWVLAAVIGGSLAVVSIERPRTAVLVTILCLPFLALLRRLLITQAPWTSHDPLLAVGPLVAAVVLAALWIRRRRPLAPDLLSKLVLALLALTLVQTLNPNGSGLEAALGGLVFMAAPLLWFFIGREIGDRQLVLVLLVGTLTLAVAIGGYGLWQAQIGLPRWDSDWLEVAGYNALYVNHGNEYTIRPFGTFSSSAEYASYLGVAIAIAAALLLHRKWWPALALPVLVAAVLFASGRTVLVLTVLGVLVVTALRTKRPRLGLSVLAGGVTAAVLALQLGGPALADATGKLNNPLLSHMAEGLAHPLDPNRSTLVAHWLLVRDGVEDSIAHPLGFGTAVTNIASEKLGSPDRVRNTEIDISNAFVSLGIVGGFIFVLIVGLVLQRVADAYRRTRDPLILAIVGLLVVTVGQWLHGGHYALAPLTWLLVGYAAAARERAAPNAAPSRSIELRVRRALMRLGSWGRGGREVNRSDVRVHRDGTHPAAKGHPRQRQRHGRADGRSQESQALSAFVSIVVPTYKRPGDLRRCLAGLRNQRRPPQEIVVILRHDDGDSREVISSIGAANVRNVDVAEPGVLAALNAGVDAARGDVIVFLDDDACPRPEWLVTLCRHFDDPQVGAVGGKDEIPNPSQSGPPTLDVGRVTRWGKVIGNHHLAAGPVREVEILKGVNMAFRRRALALPVELRGTGSQPHYEVLACLWAGRQSWRLVFDPTAVVDHYASPRPAGDDRGLPGAHAARDASFNLVACLLTARPELAWRRALYGLVVGDGETPGMLRGLGALLQGNRQVARRLLPSLVGQLQALREHAAGRAVRLRTFPERAPGGRVATSPRASRRG
jgi:hypothetical protein